MVGVARLPAEERGILFTEAAARKGILALLVEKDFWVCWLLARLYAMDGIPRLLFKGGTSLSKGFAAIQRFSEDIDLGLERADLRLGDGALPHRDRSRKANVAAVGALRDHVHAYVRDDLAPRLRADAVAVVGDDIEFVCERDGHDTVVRVLYPKALAPSTYPADPAGYVRPEVRLEIGARSDHYPTREIDVRSYAAEAVPEAFQTPSCRVVAQAPERTLLEKALILHAAVAKGAFKDKSSRHAYDLAILANDESIVSNVSLELFRAVAEQKRTFADDRTGDSALRDGLRLVPHADALTGLAHDYAKMQDMIIGEAPSLDAVLAALAGLEHRLRALTHG